MNLLFYSTVFPDANDPSRGTYNLELCRALAKEHRVRAVAPREWISVLKGRAAGRTMASGAPIRRAGIEADYPTYWYPPKVLREQYGDCLWRSSHRCIERLAQTFRPDGVLSYWAHPDGEAALRVARSFAVPAVVIVGGSDVLLLPKCPRRGTRVRKVLEESDAVVTVSEGLRKSVINLGVDPSRVHTVTQGVNPAYFSPGDRSAMRERMSNQCALLAGNRPLLLWVGRMVPVKRLDVLIDACAILRRQNQDFVLVLAGDGPLRKSVEAQVAAQRLVDSVCYLGAQTPARLGDWYRAANCTVLSSESEGLPNVLRESLACGTPFVATDVGSIREIAEKKFSILTDTGDPAALAKGIQSVLEGAYQQQAGNYEAKTWDDTAQDILRIFRECRDTPDMPGAENLAAMTSRQ